MAAVDMMVEAMVLGKVVVVWEVVAVGVVALAVV